MDWKSSSLRDSLSNFHPCPVGIFRGSCRSRAPHTVRVSKLPACVPGRVQTKPRELQSNGLNPTFRYVLAFFGSGQPMSHNSLGKLKAGLTSGLSLISQSYHALGEGYFVSRSSSKGTNWKVHNNYTPMAPPASVTEPEMGSSRLVHYRRPSCASQKLVS